MAIDKKKFSLIVLGCEGYGADYKPLYHPDRDEKKKKENGGPLSFDQAKDAAIAFIREHRNGGASGMLYRIKDDISGEVLS